MITATAIPIPNTTLPQASLTPPRIHMAYVQSSGARIHYQVEGTGPPVVIVHGFSDSLVDWYEAGYVEALRDDYRLVMIDCRGHGLSDKPHAQEAYTMEMRVADVHAVMDAMDIETAHYWGYSMGSRIGFGVFESAPERILSVIMAGIDQHGTHPRRFENRIRFLSKGIEPYLEGFEGRFGRMEPEAKRARFLQNDCLAMIASTMGLRDHVRDYSDLSEQLTVPCLSYDGDEDAFHDDARTFADTLPDAKFVSLPGQDHGGTFTRSDLVLPHVQEFLSQTSH